MHKVESPAPEGEARNAPGKEYPGKGLPATHGRESFQATTTQRTKLREGKGKISADTYTREGHEQEMGTGTIVASPVLYEELGVWDCLRSLLFSNGQAKSAMDA